MKIKSLYDSSFVELTFNQDNAAAPQCQDDLAIDVEVFSSQGFYGSRREVWFQRQTLDKFIHALEVFEATRRGAAILSKCPQSAHNDFELQVAAADAGQPLFLAIDLLRIAYTPDDQLHPFRVSMHFEFDPAMLPSIVKDFKRLFRVDT